MHYLHIPCHIIIVRCGLLNHQVQHDRPSFPSSTASPAHRWRHTTAVERWYSLRRGVDRGWHRMRWLMGIVLSSMKNHEEQPSEITSDYFPVSKFFFLNNPSRSPFRSLSHQPLPKWDDPKGLAGGWDVKWGWLTNKNSLKLRDYQQTMRFYHQKSVMYSQYNCNWHSLHSIKQRSRKNLN
jgi:hypothetical protein